MSLSPHAKSLSEKDKKPYMPKPYQVCNQCVMDTSDPEISFNKEGICSHCQTYPDRKRAFILPEKNREKRLENLITFCKNKGRGKQVSGIRCQVSGRKSEVRSPASEVSRTVCNLRLPSILTPVSWLPSPDSCLRRTRQTIVLTLGTATLYRKTAPVNFMDTADLSPSF